MVRHPLHFFRGHFGSANIQPSIDLHGIRTDDLAAKAFGQGDRECGFTIAVGPPMATTRGLAALCCKTSKLFFQLLPGQLQHAGAAMGHKTAAHCRP